MENLTTSNAHQIQLNDDICRIIEGSRRRLATTVNAEVCMLHPATGSPFHFDWQYRQSHKRRYSLQPAG